jgi:hypothetical protein
MGPRQRFCTPTAALRAPGPGASSVASTAATGGPSRLFLSSSCSHRYALKVSGEGWPEGAKARAARIKVREIEAHRWVIDLHEDAAPYLIVWVEPASPATLAGVPSVRGDMLRLALVSRLRLGSQPPIPGANTKMVRDLH